MISTFDSSNNFAAVASAADLDEAKKIATKFFQLKNAGATPRQTPEKEKVFSQLLSDDSPPKQRTPIV